jgi:hypothetical protein
MGHVRAASESLQALPPSPTLAHAHASLLDFGNAFGVALGQLQDAMEAAQAGDLARVFALVGQWQTTIRKRPRLDGGRRGRRLSPEPLAAGLRNQSQRGVHDLGQVRAELVEAPEAALEAADEPGSLEFGEMVADGWLAQVEGRGEVAHADGFAGVLEQVEHLHTRWIGEGPEQGGELIGLVLGEERSHRHTAAFDPRRRIRFEQGEASHATSLADALTDVDASPTLGRIGTRR